MFDVFSKPSRHLRKTARTLQPWRGGMQHSLLALIWCTCTLLPKATLAQNEDNLRWPNFWFVPRAQLDYKIEGKTHGFSYPARAHMKWTAVGKRYEASLEVGLPLIGARTQNSEGQLSSLGVQPSLFKDHQRQDHQAQFLPQENLIRWSDTPALSLPLEAQTQDALSVFFHLGALVWANPDTLSLGKTWSLPIVLAQSKETWTFKYLGQEAINVPMGEIKCWHFERLARDKDDKQQVHLWLGQSTHALPVRILIEQGENERVDQLLSNAQW